MRTLTTILLLIITNSILAQKTFEGKITYQLTGSRQKINALADVYFKHNKLNASLRTAAGEEKSKDDLLILIEEGTVYHLNLAENTCRTDDLRKPFALSAPTFINNPSFNKSILGFYCNAVTLDQTNDNRFMGGAAITLWTADSLLFPCNKKFATGEMSVAFINGTNINLAAQFIFNTPEGKDTANLGAILIQPGILNDSIFLLPPGMKAVSNIPNREITPSIQDDSAVIAAADSASKIVDSVVKSIMKKQAAKQRKTQKSSLKSSSRKRSSENTHKQPTKSPATKPKESVTY